MRILHIGKFFPPDLGGMEVFLADLVGAQREAGDDSFVLVHGEPRFEDPDWLVRVPVAINLVYTPIAPAFRSALAQAIRRFEPDVLHLHMPNPSVFWALTLAVARKIPWVVHWHADVVATSGTSLLSLAYRAYRPFEQAVLERAGCIIVTSPDYLAASVPLRPWQEKCAVVPLALDIRRLPLEPGAHPASDAWPIGDFRLLSLGRLSHYKGFETLVDAVAGMNGVHLVIAGDGEVRTELQSRISAQGDRARTSLVGQVDEHTKHALFAGCDAFCLASYERTEAFGIAVMEAMRYGRPCIVSDLKGSGLPWLVRSSRAGLTVPVGHSSAWQVSIQSLREDPQLGAMLGEGGRAAINTRFDIRPATLAVRAVYPRPEVVPVRFDQPLIVIPARNEGSTIAGVITAVRGQGFEHVLVVSDQSHDDTVANARAAGARVLEPVLPLGAWGAMQTGIRYALQHGYGQVITLDADGQHEPAYIPTLLEAATGNDVVIGAYPERGSLARRIAWWYFRAITGFRIEDLTSGFRCYSRAACEILADDEATLLDYQDLGVLLLLRRAGLSIVEVPVEMYPRVGGPSRIFGSWPIVARYMLESTLLCLSRWHPKHTLSR